MRSAIYEFIESVERFGEPITLNNIFDSGKPWSVAVTLVSIAISLIVCVVLIRLLLSKSRYGFVDQTLMVSALKGRHYIHVSTITEIKRVKRNGKRDSVRIAYRRVGKEVYLDIKPRDPVMFVHDLVSRCPQLKRFEMTKLKRDASFRDAILATA